MTDIAKVYAEGRGRITELVAGLSDDEAAAKVPTCPEWTVHDVVAHLTGVCADVLAGNLGDVATDPWTAAQVDTRRDKSMKELVDEWSELAPQVEAFAGSFPGRAGDQWVTDLTTHEHDIRGALGRPGARDSDGVAVGVDFLVALALHGSLAARGLGPIEVRADGHAWVVGSSQPVGADGDAGAQESFLAGEDPAPATDPPVGTLTAAPFELFRALTGRRSSAQVAQFAWSMDPGPFLAAFAYGPFALSATDISE
jgi:uncharacterized protein (TIGR03083 family)